MKAIYGREARFRQRAKPEEVAMTHLWVLTYYTADKDESEDGLTDCTICEPGPLIKDRYVCTDTHKLPAQQDKQTL